MVNVNKIKSLAAAQGIKLGFLCQLVGVPHTYFADVRRHNRDIPNDRLTPIADALGTTTAYLRDETDDPAPADDKKEKPGARSAEPESPLDNQLFDILPHLSEAQKRFLLDQAELLYERQQAKASDSHR